MVVALGSLLWLPACTAPQKAPGRNKLQESESRFWRHPDETPRPRSSGTPSNAAKRDEGPPLNVEDPPLPFEVAERVGAELDIACGDNHPAAADVTKVEPVEITPEGEKALLVTVRQACICGATGNCPRQVWTLDRNHHFEQTLSDQAYELLLANTAHNGRYDVITEAYLSARESAILRYEWDGKMYLPAEQSCRVGDGDVATRKIVPGKCR